MVLIDTKSPNPVTLVTNDYAIALQTTIAVGHFIQRPGATQLSLHSTIDHKVGSHISVSNTPLFIGTYHSSSIVRIVLKDGTLLASGVVLTNGRYHAQVHTPMANGNYTVYAQAQDVYGDLSKLSLPYHMVVHVPRTGPHPKN